RELFFVGHSPDTGDVGNNEALGLILAGAARDAILETDTEGRLDATVVRTVSMGALAPMACDTDDAADDMNRRVEVWVRK
ncbi:MAG: cell envelope biogenesis protein OmpA, partial [Pseudomonadota bacterium]